MSFLGIEDKLDKLAKWYKLFAAKNTIVSYLVQTNTKTLRSIRSTFKYQSSYASRDFQTLVPNLGIKMWAKIQILQNL